MVNNQLIRLNFHLQLRWSLTLPMFHVLFHVIITNEAPVTIRGAYMQARSQDLEKGGLF